MENGMLARSIRVALGATAVVLLAAGCGKEGKGGTTAAPGTDAPGAVAADRGDSIDATVTVDTQATPGEDTAHVAPAD
jgi:hypothetical protein